MAVKTIHKKKSKKLSTAKKKFRVDPDVDLFPEKTARATETIKKYKIVEQLKKFKKNSF